MTSPTAPFSSNASTLEEEPPALVFAELAPPLTSTTFQRISWQADVAPQLRFGVVLTAAFCVAWGWDLVLYSASHAVAGVNPLQQEIGFGDDDANAPKHLVVLVFQYLVVCAAAARLSAYCSSSSQRDPGWWHTTTATVQAVEFFPSPVFAGKLMAWLGQFAQLSAVQRGALNLGATLAAAVLAHYAMPNHLGGTAWHRFTPIVRTTLGFGLGIAWNVFLGQLLGPQRNDDDDDDDDDFDIVHFVAMAGYLAVVLLLALRVAALKYEYPSTTPTTTDPLDNINDSSNSYEPTLWERQCDLASFATQVVVAFTLVEFLDRFVTHAAWYGTAEAIFILLIVSAVLNALVASVDLEALRRQQQEQVRFDGQSGGGSNPAMCLLWIPCLWCCCPWLPVLVILSHLHNNASTVSLKQDWYAVIAMVTGLAASIEASNLVTAAVNAMAASFCTAKHCAHPWMFVALQAVVAAVMTVVILPALGPLCRDDEPFVEHDQKNDKVTGARGEKQALLSA